MPAARSARSSSSATTIADDRMHVQLGMHVQMKAMLCWPSPLTLGGHGLHDERGPRDATAAIEHNELPSGGYRQRQRSPYPRSLPPYRVRHRHG